MPIRVRSLVAFLAAGWLAMVAAGVRAAAWITPAGSAGVVVFLVAAGAYVLYVYYPPFDPAGQTVWRGDRKGALVAITFDDGPGNDTAAILDVLARKGVAATFFFLGENAGRHPDLVARARAEGHAVGNHGTTHVKMHRLGVAAIERELRGGEGALGAIATLGGRKILRVPHGFKSITLARTARRLGYTLVAWTAGVWDSDRPGAEVIASRAAAAIGPGCILLLHDGDGTKPAADRSQTAAALPAIIDHGLQAGYRFVTIPQLFERR